MKVIKRIEGMLILITEISLLCGWFSLQAR